jgi:glycosyltransferase involved in cell wall biosynthesis
MSRLCVIHTMDPRGSKVGGIETHVRQVLTRTPADVPVLFVGIDGRGDLEPGRPVELDVGRRKVTFLPVVHIPEDEMRGAATSVLRSVTWRFVTAALRHLPSLWRTLRAMPTTVDLQRFEFWPLPLLMGLPFVMWIHNEGTAKDKMDSLLKRYWFLHEINERIALALAGCIICVNASILARLTREQPRAAAKAEVMPVSVDPEIFAPAPFDTADGVLRIVFTGRLDEFKDPPTLFRVCAELHRRLNGAFEFHYVGTTDPHRYAEFAAIEAFTIRHGFKDAAGVAAVLRHCHLGMLTSFFEGMPCFLLETLASGRAFAALRLPQFDPVVKSGLSGVLVARTDDNATTVEALATATLGLWDIIRAGQLAPEAIADVVAPYRIERQLSRLIAHHHALGGAHAGRASPPGLTLDREARP